MSKTLKVTLIVLAVLIVGASLLLTGIAIGRMSWGLAGNWLPLASAYQPDPNRAPFGYMPWQGMMGGFFQNAPSAGPDQDSYQPGYGWSGGMMGGGMMGGFGGGLSQVEPLSLDQAQQAVEGYLAPLGDPNLAVEEVMIFDNHAYAEIVEIDSGIGAMEVLVDPVSLAVYPEHGPNMMWNLKYGMMSGGSNFGMMGGFRPWGNRPQAEEVSAEMPVSEEDALKSAQAYLDRFLPGSQVDEHTDHFYGYYTIHVLRDGNVVGMLSVNGFTKQVFPHTWHGVFIEMSAE